MRSLVAHIMVIVTTAFLTIGVTLGIFVPLAQAAASTATPDTTSMCEPIGVVGNVIISRCIDDETSIVLYVNSAGFMILGE